MFSASQHVQSFFWCRPPCSAGEAGSDEVLPAVEDPDSTATLEAGEGLPPPELEEAPEGDEALEVLEIAGRGKKLEERLRERGCSLCRNATFWIFSHA